MSVTWTPFKTFSRLKSIINDYKQAEKKCKLQEAMIQKDARYTAEAKLSMINDLKSRLSAEHIAAETNIRQLRQDYAKELENSSVVTILNGDKDLSLNLSILSDNEIRILKSLNYIDLNAREWARIAENVNPDMRPAFAAAITKKAAEKGYELRGWYQSPEDKLKEFDTAAESVEKVLKAYSNSAENAPWIEVDALHVIDNAVEKYDPFDAEGHKKAPEPVVVLPIPETVEQAIQQELQGQIDAKTAAEADASLEERVAIAEAFGDPEYAKIELMGAGIAKVNQIRFEAEYGDSPIDKTAAEQIEYSKSGAAIE